MERTDAVALAGRIADRVVALPGLRMVMVAGSVARCLADDSSDLDLYLYWNRVDVAALSSPNHFESVGARRVFAMQTANGWFEKLEHSDRFVDVESVPIATLETAADLLTHASAPPGWVVKVAAGLRDAIAIHGSDELTHWRHQLTYGDNIATAEVAVRAPRLLAPSAIYQLTYARDDVLSFTARISQLLLDVVGLLGAVNRRFVPTDEPKWLPWHLTGLDHRPADIVQRIDIALRRPSATAMSDLDLLVRQTLDLVDEHVPGVDTRTARYATNLHPRPTP